MRAWLKALLLFGVMVVTPFVIQSVVGRTPRWFDLFPYFSVADFVPSIRALIYIVGVLGVVAVVFNFIFYSTGLDEIHGWLKLAEREMNVILRGVDAASSKGRAADRIEWWNTLTGRDAFSKTPDKIFDLNEEDAKARGAPNPKAAITAFLLREIYEGNIDLAQNKILAEMKANDGKVPHVVAGLREILGLDEYLAAKAKFESDKEAGVATEEPRFGDFGVAWVPLLAAVKLGRFPRNITMSRTDNGVKIEVKNEDALDALTRVQV